MWKIIVFWTLFLNNGAFAGHLISCYYRNWSQYAKGPAKFLPKDIDPKICRIVKFAFMEINPKTFKLETRSSDDVKILAELNKFKVQNPTFKVIIAVGGWSHEYGPKFARMTETAERRQIFIRSVIDFLNKHKLDGLNYNWLYPTVRPESAQPVEKQKFTALLKETYQAFKSAGNCFYLSATVSSSVKHIRVAYEVDKIAKYVDSIDVIVQSLWGHWKGRTGTPTAMKGNQQTIIETLEAWLDAGMPAKKINIGFSLYGRTFKLKSPSQYKIGARTIGPGTAGTYTRKKGVLAYYEICHREWTQQTSWESSETETPYASYGDLWVAYDNPSSYKYKIQYLLQTYQVNGVTLWAMDFDDFTGSFCKDGKFPLARRIYEALRQAETEVQKPKVECKVAVDIGFLLDSSGSLKAQYQMEKDFIKAVAKAFGLSQDGSRAAVITFSYWAEQSIKLKDFFNILSFSAAVDAIPFMGYTTRIDLSLRLTQKAMFTKENGTREGNPKLLVLITDGTQTKGEGHEHPGDIADELRKAGVTIIVVGVGQHTDPHELKHLAGGEENLFQTPSFEELTASKTINDVRQQSCPAELKTSTPDRFVEKAPPGEESCSFPLE